MTFWKTLRVAWEGLMMNKGRSLLTTLGVIIGVAAVIVMLAVSAGAEAEIAAQINALGTNLIMVLPSFSRGSFRPGSAPPSLTYADLAVIQSRVPDILGVSAEQDTSQNVTGNSDTLTGVAVVGTTPGFTLVREYPVAVGRFILDSDEQYVAKVAVLGHDVATELFGDPRSAVGQSVKIGSAQCVVIGVMSAKGVVGNTNYDSRVYIPITLFFEKFAFARFGSDRLNVVYVSALSPKDMTLVMSDLRTVLMQILGTTAAAPGFQLTTQESIINAQASTTATFRNLLGWVAGISLVVGGIGIMNIMLVSVSERTREIGLRQALGARQRDVRLQFLLEAFVLSLMGGIAGIVVGVVGSLLLNALGTMQTQLVGVSIPLSFGAAAAVGIFFGYYPATQAAQLDPIVALRHE